MMEQIDEDIDPMSLRQCLMQLQLRGNVEHRRYTKFRANGFQLKKRS
jgi:hypothetical protein